jgi:hypothetical protein
VGFEARDCFQKAHDLVGAQHGRKLARLACIGDALRQRALANCHAVEESQRADDLVQRQIADRHVLHHAAAKRADLSQSENLLSEGLGCEPTILSDRRRRRRNNRTSMLYRSSVGILAAPLIV